MLEVTRRICIPRDEFKITFSRSSGPGGQNVNKVNTKATLHWSVKTTLSLPEDVRRRFFDQNRSRINSEGEIVIQSQRYRDQARNKNDCLNKLRELLLAAAPAPKVRKPTRRSAGSVRRRLENKKRQSEKKQSRRSPRDD